MLSDNSINGFGRCLPRHALSQCVASHLLYDSSAGPQTGVVLPNGVVPNRGGPTERAPKEEIRSSEIPIFRMFDKITEE